MVDIPKKEHNLSLDTRYIITVLAHDRVGIVGDVSEVLYKLGANLEALSQTVVWDWFTMIVCGDFPPAVNAGQIQHAVEQVAGCSVIVAPFEEGHSKSKVSGEPFVVTIVGEDKPGIVFRLTRYCGEQGINLEDVWNEVRDGRFIVIFHVTLPSHLDAKAVRYDLEHLAGDIGVSLSFQHQDIFTAMNSLQVHTKEK
jgi:glycine cleavage system transcriptional repressor